MTAKTRQATAETGKIFYTVTKFPDRKRSGLYRVIGNVYEPIAYFKNDEVAERFRKEVGNA